VTKAVVVIWEDPRTIRESKVIQILSHPLGEDDSMGLLDQLFFLWSRGPAGNNEIDISIDTRMEGKNHILKTLVSGKSGANNRGFRFQCSGFSFFVFLS
jgi:hypothetical protein